MTAHHNTPRCYKQRHLNFPRRRLTITSSKTSKRRSQYTIAQPDSQIERQTINHSFTQYPVSSLSQSQQLKQHGNKSSRENCVTHYIFKGVLVAEKKFFSRFFKQDKDFRAPDEQQLRLRIFKSLKESKSKYGKPKNKNQFLTTRSENTAAKCSYGDFFSRRTKS